MKQILKIRADIEDIKFEVKALDALAKVAESSSLRYVMQLLTPARILAEAAGRKIINPADIISASKFFLDSRASARRIQEGQGFLQ